jgi:GDP-L-fucose synthase
MNLENKRVIVTGGAGFLGSHLVAKLERLRCTAIHVPRTAAYDLVRPDDVRKLYKDAQPDVVFHLAARVGGIGANEKNPGSYFHDNMMMGMNVLEQGRRAGVAKIVMTGTICSYPKFAPIPFREDDLWNGYPEETNAPYGVAKKALLVMAEAYRRQYGVDAICLLPVNLYGPRDNFDLDTSHVIPAMIRKFLDANARKESEVVLWGDGSPTREFLYVDDCADALLLAAQHCNDSEPVNVGAGREISIKALAELIAKLTGFEGRVVWDVSRPNGQPRRMLDTTRARERFGFEASTALELGLEHTIAWYRTHARHRELET